MDLHGNVRSPGASASASARQVQVQRWREGGGVGAGKPVRCEDAGALQGFDSMDAHLNCTVQYYTLPQLNVAGVLVDRRGFWNYKRNLRRWRCCKVSGEDSGRRRSARKGKTR